MIKKVFTPKVYIVTVFVLSILASCKDSFSPVLREVDKVLFTDSERGEEILDSISQTTSNMSTADSKYWQLLKLKAADKAYRPISNQKDRIDSLVSYFEHAGDEGLLAEVYFYAGRVNYEIGDKPESLKYYQKASEKVAKDNYALQGDIYCQMANVYRYTDLDKEAIGVLELALKADSLSGNTRNVLYDIRDMGEAYSGLKQIDKAQSYYLKGLRMAELHRDSLLILLFHHGLAETYKRKGEIKNALYYIEKGLCNRKLLNDQNGILVSALDIYTMAHNVELATKYRNLIIDSGNVESKRHALGNLLNTITAKDTIGKISRLFVICNDSVQKLRNTEAIKKAEQLYNYKLKEKENEILAKENEVKNAFIFMAILLFVTSVFCLLMKSKNMQQQQALLTLKINKMEDLKKQTEAKTKEKIAIELESIDSSKIQNIINTEIANGTYKLTEEEWQEVTKLINSIYPGFDRNLDAFLKTNPLEYKICLMIKLGISPSNMAKFVNVTKEAVTACRRRMYIKVFKKKGTPSDWDKVILSL